MPRSVKAPEDRRSEILQVSQRLFYTKGYENTSVRDIIDEVGIAKGTFYHHFDSKQALLEALIGNILEQSVQLLEPIVHDPYLSALEKFHRLFASIGNLKLENEQIIRVFLQIWYKDENAIMREKMKQESLKRVSPLFNAIICQGVTEGCFSTAYPDEIGEIILGIGQGFSEMLTSLLLQKGDPVVDLMDVVAKKIAVYEYALEQVLGAAPGTIKILDIEQWKPWFEDLQFQQTA